MPLDARWLLLVGFAWLAFVDGASGLRGESNVALSGTHETPAKPLLVLNILGDFTAAVGGCDLAFSTRKAKALAAYLALSENGQDTRERLVGLLWSESDEERARASLRQVVRDIKLVCDSAGFEGFRADKQTLSLARQSFSCDVEDVLSAVAGGAVHRRLLDTQRIDETLLAGLDNIDPAFHVWVLAKRQLLRDRLTLTLERLLTSGSDAAESDATAIALLNLDPTHEVACRHLIRARAARGDTGGAMKVYKALWDLLDAEYDIEPSPETQELIVDIKQASGPSGVQAAAPPFGTPRAPSALRRLFISVCAFDLTGVPEDRRHVVNGFRHEFVACLARFREWSVRTLRLPWDGEMAAGNDEPRTWSSPPEYVVEGSAYESGGAIRLVITFRDAITSVCIWSERYSVTLPDWYETQQHIVRQIATALNVHVSAERLRRATNEVGVDLEVHDRWLRGQALLHQVTPTDLKAASLMIEELMRDAPDFSPAISGMVQINNMEHIVYPGYFRDNAKHLKTLQMAQRAVHLDPLDSRAQLSLAWSYQLVGRVQESTFHAALATELNDNDPWTLMSAGQIFCYCGNYERAQALASNSLELTRPPTRSQMTYLSAIQFLCAKYDESVESAQQGFDASPGFLGWTCAALGQLGRVNEAKRVLDCAFTQVAANWEGSTKPIPADMTRWMLHIFPIAIREDWERLRAGMAAAGAPVEGIVFGRW